MQGYSGSTSSSSSSRVRWADTEEVYHQQVPAGTQLPRIAHGRSSSSSSSESSAHSHDIHYLSDAMSGARLSSTFNRGHAYNSSDSSTSTGPRTPEKRSTKSLPLDDASPFASRKTTIVVRDGRSYPASLAADLRRPAIDVGERKSSRHLAEDGGAATDPARPILNLRIEIRHGPSPQWIWRRELKVQSADGKSAVSIAEVVNAIHNYFRCEVTEREASDLKKNHSILARKRCDVLAWNQRWVEEIRLGDASLTSTCVIVMGPCPQ